MDRRVLIVKRTYNPDDLDDTGARVPVMSDVGTVWANINFIAARLDKDGTMDYNADTWVSNSTVVVTIRYRNDIKVSPVNYLVYDNKNYFIRTVGEIGRRRYLELKCVEKSSDGNS